MVPSCRLWRVVSGQASHPDPRGSQYLLLRKQGAAVMAETTRHRVEAKHRLTPRPTPTEIIQREVPIRFTFNGRRYTGYEGDTISSALWANGVHILSRSFKYHRPRADFTMDGSDPNALVNIGDEPNVRAGRQRIAVGMEIHPQNVNPSLDFDILALNGVFHRFLPVGFYYKAFHSKRLWPVYEKLFRRLAGLGQVDPNSPARYYDKQYKHADVIVAGGGPAGLSAALAAAEAGARVLLIEQDPFLGGQLRYRRGELEGRSYATIAEQLVGQVEAHEGIEVLQGAVAMGYYDDHWVPAFTDDRLYKIRGSATVVTTGALDRTLIFTNNDLPGILTGSAAARLLNLYAIRPGEQVLVVSANDDGLRLALDLHEAGIAVTVADERAEDESDVANDAQSTSIPIRWRHTIGAAHGKRHVTGASLLPLNPDDNPPSSAVNPVHIDCDTIVLSVGYTPNADLLYQSHSKLAWSQQMREIFPVELAKGVHAAGRVFGSHDLGTALLEGRVAGVNAAADAGFGHGAGEADVAQLQSLKSNAKPSTTLHYSIPSSGNFRFVDFAEDVTEKDVYDALAEGYDSIELLKRYTTISMGPDQGRYSSINTGLLTADAQGWTVEQMGTTTSRPPLFPVKIGTLAGRLMEPVRRTSLHHWHERYGCTWLNAGQWKRPEHYHNHTPEREVLNVRQNVGMIDVSTLGKVRLYGRDVPELLSRLYTNKWHKLEVGKVRYGV
ncbi:MAG: FAD-dependent oxidoreductase, partial [Candidatus Bipolaricaulia bacterium]